VQPREKEYFRKGRQPGCRFLIARALFEWKPRRGGLPLSLDMTGPASGQEEMLGAPASSDIGTFLSKCRSPCGKSDGAWHCGLVRWACEPAGVTDLGTYLDQDSGFPATLDGRSHRGRGERTRNQDVWARRIGISCLGPSGFFLAKEGPITFRRAMESRFRGLGLRFRKENEVCHGSTGREIDVLFTAARAGIDRASVESVLGGAIDITDRIFAARETASASAGQISHTAARLSVLGGGRCVDRARGQPAAGPP